MICAYGMKQYNTTNFPSNTKRIYYQHHSKCQWWKVTKYIYSSTILKYNFEELVLEYFHFLLLYTSTPLQFRENIVLFTSLHL